MQLTKHTLPIFQSFWVPLCDVEFLMQEHHNIYVAAGIQVHPDGTSEILIDSTQLPFQQMAQQLAITIQMGLAVAKAFIDAKVGKIRTEATSVH